MKVMILGALLSSVVIAPAAAQEAVAVEQVAKEEKMVEGADSDEARLVNACTARKFEVTAVLDKEGTKRVTKLKLCSNPGADDMAWIATLEAAKARVGGIPDLAPDSRVRIEAEFAAEIVRLNKAMGH